MNIDKKALKGFVDEIEASRARQKGETEFQREVFKKIKAAQLDAKAVRIVLQRRAMGDAKRDEQDYYVHAYELALGGKKAAMEALERGASTREAAKIGGISNGAAAALAKGAQKSSFVSTTPNDPETGEINESCGGGESRPVPCGAPSKRDAPAEMPIGEAGVAPGPQDISCPKAQAASDTVIARVPDDDLAIPSFLRRVTAYA